MHRGVRAYGKRPAQRFGASVGAAIRRKWETLERKKTTGRYRKGCAPSDASLEVFRQSGVAASGGYDTPAFLNRNKRRNAATIELADHRKAPLVALAGAKFLALARMLCATCAKTFVNGLKRRKPFFRHANAPAPEKKARARNMFEALSPPADRSASPARRPSGHWPEWSCRRRWPHHT